MRHKHHLSVLAIFCLAGCGNPPRIVKVETWPDKAHPVDFGGSVRGAVVTCEIPGRKTFSDGHVEDYGLRFYVQAWQGCK